MNKKKKSTNTSPYPDEVIDRLARAFYPAILACWNSEEGQREFAAWQAEQAHHTTSKEKTERSRRGNALLYISLSYVDFVRVRPIRGAPCFCFVLNLLTRDFLPRFADILPVRRSESVLHTPEGHYR